MQRQLLAAGCKVEADGIPIQKPYALRVVMLLLTRLEERNIK